MKTLPIEPLTAEAFAPFGEVIETEGRDYYLINSGSTRRYHRLADIDANSGDGQPVVSIFRARRPVYPLTIGMMERHPLGSQAFIPLKGHPFLIVVAPAGERVNREDLRAFISNGRQGVNYRRGVWHHPLLVLQPEDELLVVDRAGSGNNCDECFFDNGSGPVIAP